MNILQDLGNLSFQLIDKMAGWPGIIPEESKNEVGLQVWYRSIYTTQFSDLAISDLARACQQEINLSYVIPYSLEILKIDPLSGDWYDGQLFLSFEKIPIDYWKSHSDDWNTFVDVLALVLNAVTVNPEADLLTEPNWNESLRNIEKLVLEKKDLITPKDEL